MAWLVYTSSSESISSQLDLLSVPPTQTSLEDGFFTEYRPISILTSNSPVEFCIAAENSNYIDFSNTFLYVRASEDGANPVENAETAPELACLYDQNKSGFLESRLFFSQSEFFEYFLNCSDWKSALHKSHFCFDYVNWLNVTFFTPFGHNVTCF